MSPTEPISSKGLLGKIVNCTYNDFIAAFRHRVAQFFIWKHYSKIKQKFMSPLAFSLLYIYMYIENKEEITKWTIKTLKCYIKIINSLNI